MNTDTERVKFIEAGYDCIPLKPLLKRPFAKAWEKRPPVSQWYNAPNNANIGLRAGNGKAFIDCDDKKTLGTSETVIRWMDGLGYALGTYPLVQTPSGGSHIYTNFTASLLGSSRNLTIGGGEFRYNYGAQVATFPSYINGVDGVGEYKLLQGDITQLPVLDMKDIAALVDINKFVADPKQKRPSALALAIMQGGKLDRYKTNSDGEMGLVLSLHNSGYTYDEIKDVFENNVCLGHYTNEHKAKGAKEAERWLRLTYKSAVTYSQESRTRQTIAAWIERAKASAWKRVTDKNLYIAHAEISYKAGKYEHAADVRTLSLSAGVGICTASKGNKRLVKAGGLVVVEPYAGLRATTYKLFEPPVSAILVHTLTEVRVDVFVNGTPKNGTIALHDAFMNGKGRLGRRAGEVYALLLSEVLTFAEIQERTGTPTRTLRRILGKLRNVKDRKTGEIIEMVSLGGDGAYFGNVVDLDLVSAIYGTYGATGKRRDEYAKDRRDRARSWELETLTKCGGSVTA